MENDEQKDLNTIHAKSLETISQELEKMGFGKEEIVNFLGDILRKMRIKMGLERTRKESDDLIIRKNSGGKEISAVERLKGSSKAKRRFF